MISSKGKVLSPCPTEDSTKAAGVRDACTVMESIPGPKDSHTKVSTTWTKRKAMVVTSGKTEGGTSETGSKTKDTEKVV